MCTFPYICWGKNNSYIGLKAPIKFFYSHSVQVLTLLNYCHLRSKTFRHRFQYFPHNSIFKNLLPKVETRVNFIIQISIELIEYLIFLHSDFLKLDVNIWNLKLVTVFFPSWVTSKISYVSLAISQGLQLKHLVCPFIKHLCERGSRVLS